MVNSTYFTYDGVFSGRYGLQIADFTGWIPESVEENEAFSPSLSILKVPSLIRFYHGGLEYDAAPTCEFSVVSESVIPPELRSAILTWLIGRKSFKPLKFHNDDWEDFVYYCVFTASSTIYVNGECHGFRLTASFDSPFARGTPTVATTTSGTHTITIENKSDIRDEYTYPKVQFTGNVSIINTTDSATRAFTFANIGASETLTVDCETKVITSSVGGEKLTNFTSKKWLRLKPGINSLSVTSSGNVTITCPWYVMIGY